MLGSNSGFLYYNLIKKGRPPYYYNLREPAEEGPLLSRSIVIGPLFNDAYSRSTTETSGGAYTGTSTMAAGS